MELAPGSAVCSFEVTYDASNLPVAMSVYDTTSSSPNLVSGPTAMTNLVGNTYYGKFTPTTGHSYVVYKAVYTDGTFTTLNSNYAAGTESMIAEDVGGGGSGGSVSSAPIIGFVIPTPTLIGFVVC